MRAIVTGGAGFVGSHLIEALVARGDDVVCIERPGASRGWLDDLPIEFVDSGLDDPAALDRYVDGADVVFHLAALTAAPRPELYYVVNAEGTANLVRAAARADGTPHVILMSSLAAVGPCRNGDLLSARTTPYPLSHYGQSKLLAESVARAHSDLVPQTTLRFPPVYGPREHDVYIMFRLVRRGLALTVGSWDREMSLIYVADAVAALLAAAQQPAAGRTYTVAHPDPVTWRRFAETVGAVMGRSPRLMALPRSAAMAVAVAAETSASLLGRRAILNRQKIREMTQRRWVCEVRTAIRELRFEPRFPIERGVAETARWYEEEGWL